MLQAAYILAGTPALPLSSEVVAHLVVRYGVPAPELRPGFVDIGVDRLGIPLQEPIDHRLRDRGNPTAQDRPTGVERLERLRNAGAAECS